MKYTRSILALTIFFFVLIGKVECQTVRTLLATGVWTNTTIWSGGIMPICGDSIVIPAVLSVSVMQQTDYSGCPSAMAINIFGSLSFQNGNKLELPCGSKVYVQPGGNIWAGGGGGNSNCIKICNVTVWSAGDGPIQGPCTLPPGGCEPLPIELSSFTATATGTHNELLWTTLTEKNNSKFEVERSNDAISFELISTLPSKANSGNSMLPLDYSLLDKNPVSNTNYYRLKQIDFDGSFGYSKLVSVSNIKDKHIKFIIYPNPNHGEFTADISGVENNHNITILLTDNTGKLVYKSSLYIQDSQHTKVQIVPDEKIADGIYFCTLMIEEIAFKVKVVVN